MLEMLQLGRIDGFVTNYLFGSLLTQNNKNIKHFIISELDIPAYLAFKKGFIDDVDLINEQLTKIIAERSNRSPHEQ